MKKNPLIHCLTTLPLVFLCQFPRLAPAEDAVPVTRGGETILMTDAEWARLKLRKGYRAETSPKSGMAASFRKPEAGEARPALVSKTPEPELPGLFPKGIGHRGVVIPVVPETADQSLSLVERLPQISPPTEKETASLLSGFRLRESWDPVKLYKFNGVWSEDATAADSDGAAFGWVNDRRPDTRTWSAKGVAYVPFILHATPDTQFLLLPSLEFNRDTANDGTANEVNSLIPRLGIDFNFVNHDDDNPRGYVVRAAAGWQTDFDFESGQWLLDLQYEPVNEAAGLGVFAARQKADRSFRVPGIRQKFSFVPLASLGSVQDAGEKLRLADLKDTYVTLGARAGLDLELEFLPSPFNTTKLGAEYRWWATVGQENKEFDYLEAHLTLPIPGDTMALKAFYRRGDAPDTLEAVDLFGVALTAKF